MKLLEVEIISKPGFSQRNTSIVTSNEVYETQWGHADHTRPFYSKRSEDRVRFVFDPNRVDCPRCGADGGWEDYDGNSEICSLCLGRTFIDLSEIEPHQLEEHEASTIAKDIDRDFKAYGHPVLTPWNYIYWLANFAGGIKLVDRLNRAFEFEMSGKREKAIEAVIGAHVFGNVGEALKYIDEWWEDE